MFFRTGRFRRADRILCSRDFGRVIKGGKRRTSKSFVIVIASHTDGGALKSTEIQNNEIHKSENGKRLGVTVSKRVGGSVVRNRVKRCIREWFRQARERLPEGSEIVVIARRAARNLSGREVALALDELLPGARTQKSDRVTAESR